MNPMEESHMKGDICHAHVWLELSHSEQIEIEP